MEGELRILVVGKTGAGKSSTANTLLGGEKFKVGHYSSSETQQAQTATTQLLGKSVKITDSPGLFDTERTDDEVTEEVVNCLEKTYPGPHAILFVMKATDRFTNEEYCSYQRIKIFYGPEVTSKMIVIITHGDDLAKKRVSLEDFIANASDKQKIVFRECGNRIVLFNNEATWDSRSEQIEELFRQVKTFGKEIYNQSPYADLTPSAKQEKLKEQLLEAQKRETENIEYIKQMQRKTEEEEQKRKAAEDKKKGEEEKKKAAERKLEEEEKKRREAERKKEEEEEKKKAAERKLEEEKKKRRKAEEWKENAIFAGKIFGGTVLTAGAVGTAIFMYPADAAQAPSLVLEAGGALSVLLG